MSGNQALIMSYCPGSSWHRLVGKYCIHERTALQMIAKLCDVLGYIHTQQVYLTPRKPRYLAECSFFFNALYDRQGVVRLVDFGRARRDVGPTGDITDVVASTLVLLEGDLLGGAFDHFTFGKNMPTPQVLTIHEKLAVYPLAPITRQLLEAALAGEIASAAAFAEELRAAAMLIPEWV